MLSLMAQVETSMIHIELFEFLSDIRSVVCYRMRNNRLLKLCRRSIQLKSRDDRMKRSTFDWSDSLVFIVTIDEKFDRMKD